MLEKPVFIQGLFAFEGFGLAHAVPLNPPATYLVSNGNRAQTIYFRAGNPTSELVYFVLTRAGKPMRYFPVGAKDAIHVPLAVLEDIPYGSSVEVLIAAPEGVNSTAVLDIGFMEIA